MHVHKCIKSLEVAFVDVRKCCEKIPGISLQQNFTDFCLEDYFLSIPMEGQ